MTRILSFVVFLILVISVYSGMHIFVYKRISSGFQFDTAQRNLLRIVFVIGGLTFFLGELLAEFRWFAPILYFGYVWLGLLSISVSVFLIEWISRFFWKGGSATPTWIALFVVLVVSGIALVKEMRPPVLHDLEIPLKGLPETLDGFTIIQISDLHIGSHMSSQRMKHIVASVNQLSPDLVVITGDLIDRDICRDQTVCPALAGIRSAHGVFAVSGNHEYYAGIETFEKLTKEAGIRVLNNEHVRIADGLQLAGIPDEESSSRFRRTGPDLKKALENADPALPVVLLKHRPTGLPGAAALGVDLQLSGHTHAGQIPPLDLIVLLLFKYPFGLHKLNNTWIYTSVGTGTWGPPMRFLSRSEIVRIRLSAYR